MITAKFKIVSFYTLNTGYEDEIENLLDSINKFDLTYWISGIKSLGSWDANTKYKVQLIKEALSHKNYNIVYVDADAIIKQYPVAFETINKPMAMHYRNGKELLSGTLFFKPCAITSKVLDMWEQLCIENPKSWDQTLLKRAIQLLGAEKYVQQLPASYCKIFDLMSDVENPVIEHYQASRKYKRALNA